MLVPAIFEIGARLIDKLFPDPQKKAEAQLELLKLQQAGEFKQIEAEVQLNLAQAEINKADAQSGSLFRGGWRPGAGWVCVIGLGYQFLMQPLLSWGSAMYALMPPPTLEIGDLMTLLFGMLGLGAMRHKERLSGKV